MSRNENFVSTDQSWISRFLRTAQRPFFFVPVIQPTLSTEFEYPWDVRSYHAAGTFDEASETLQPVLNPSTQHALILGASSVLGASLTSNVYMDYTAGSHPHLLYSAAGAAHIYQDGLLYVPPGWAYRITFAAATGVTYDVNVRYVVRPASSPLPIA